MVVPGQLDLTPFIAENVMECLNEVRPFHSSHSVRFAGLGRPPPAGAPAARPGPTRERRRRAADHRAALLAAGEDPLHPDQGARRPGAEDSEAVHQHAHHHRLRQGAVGAADPVTRLR